MGEPKKNKTIHQIDESKLASTRIIDNGEFERNTQVADRDTVTIRSQSDARMDELQKTIGEFRLLKKLGEGAMGVVYKAFQESFERIVAIKILYKQVANNPKLVERLYREALVMGRLDHPNIVRGYGVGEDQGWHYFAMEYVDGTSLQNIIDRTGKLDIGNSLYTTIACARGLQYAHDNDLIHRDVKPDNILITRKGKVKIADLGMVKNLEEDMSLTQTGHAVGTPWYMPLEQARNAKDSDGRSDIYALGCVLYAMITGKPPFLGPTLVDVIRAKELGTFATARKFNSEVPERLDLIIAKMTAKRPEHRYRNCNQVIQDLESLGLAYKQLTILKPSNKNSARSVPAAPKTGILKMSPLEEKWYLRVSPEEGEAQTTELTTQELLKVLKSGDFDAAAELSRRPDKEFRALATYREFRHLVLGRVSKKAADARAARYRNLFEKVEPRESVQDRSEETEDTGNFEYWLSFGIKAGAAIGGIAVLIIILVMLLKALG